jgi:hypothetical protein
MFRVGQKVTMIAPHQFDNMWEDEVQPLFGAVYTIRAIFGPLLDGRTGLLFEEIKNPSDRYFDAIEAAFNSARFRPIVARKTSIAVFEAMLKRVPATAAPTAKHIPAHGGGVS